MFVLSWHSYSSVCTASYHAIVLYRLVPLRLSTYYPVRLVTILRISTFQFGTQYLTSCTALVAVQLARYLFQNRKAEFARIVNSGTRWYKVGRYRYRAVEGGTVLYLSTNKYVPCHTKYIGDLN